MISLSRESVQDGPVKPLKVTYSSTQILKWSSPTRISVPIGPQWRTGNHPSTASPRRKFFSVILVIPRTEGLESFFSCQTMMSRFSKGGRPGKVKRSCQSGDPGPFFTIVRLQRMSFRWISQDKSISIPSYSRLVLAPPSFVPPSYLVSPRFLPWKMVKSTCLHIRYEPPSVGKNNRP